MIELGKKQVLRVIRRTDPGMYLSKDNEEEVVLLPNKYIPEGLQVDQQIEVFIYKDSEDRLIATNLAPKITLGTFACLQVKDVNDNGVFLDWGLEKDLLVPFGEQKKMMRKGEHYLVYLYHDKDSDRLVATSKIDRFLDQDRLTMQTGDEVPILIGDTTPIGVNVVINDLHRGLIYHNEIFKRIEPNERTIGYIKEIREGNKIDVSLQPVGFKNIDPSARSIMDALSAHNGFLDLGDNSDPEEIKDRLQMSKKTFKKAIGSLYKQRLIEITDGGIRAIKR